MFRLETYVRAGVIAGAAVLAIAVGARPAAAQWRASIAGYGAAAITPAVTTHGSGPSSDFRIDYLKQRVDTAPVLGASIQIFDEGRRLAWGPVFDVRYYRARQQDQNVAITGTDSGDQFTDNIPLPRIDEPSLDLTAGLGLRWRATRAPGRGAVTVLASAGAGLERQRQEYNDEDQLRVNDVAPALRVGVGIEVAASARVGVFMAYDLLTSNHTVLVAGETDTTRNTVNHVTGGVRFVF